MMHSGIKILKSGTTSYTPGVLFPHLLNRPAHCFNKFLRQQFLFFTGYTLPPVDPFTASRSGVKLDVSDRVDVGSDGVINVVNHDAIHFESLDFGLIPDAVDDEADDELLFHGMNIGEFFYAAPWRAGLFAAIFSGAEKDIPCDPWRVWENAQSSVEPGFEGGIGLPDLINWSFIDCQENIITLNQFFNILS